MSDLKRELINGTCSSASTSAKHLRETQSFYWLLKLIFSFFLAVVLVPELNAMQEKTSTVAELTRAIDEAETAYKENRFPDAAGKIDEAIQSLTAILAATKKSDVPTIRLQHRRIVAAQRMLRNQKQKTQRLPRLKFNYVEEEEAMSEAGSDSDKMLFTVDVAPILAQKCGRCHISRRSGDVSLASISQMVGLIETGKSEDSQLYSVIEDGSMPKGNNKLTDEEKSKIKNWIDQGAKLDGGQLDFDLRPLMQMAAPARPRNVAVEMATDTDTVFFSRDIAPMLVESCNGCHIGARQVRGGLVMDNFARMMQGGDSGALVVAGKPEESLLVQKLKGMGDGQRMPINRPKWNDAQIEKVSTWIREGAHYDSLDPNTPIASLVSLSKIASMDLQTLTEHRVKVAEDQWKLALVDLESEIKDEGAFHYVFGYGVRSETRNAIIEQTQKVYDELSPEILGEKAPAFSKAPITIFVPKSGYDYSEFAKMVEKREADLDERYHWDQSVDGPYLVIRGSMKPEEVATVIPQILPAALVASWQPNLPKWFCDSVGSSAVDWNSAQLKQAGAYLAANAPSNATIRQWVSDRLVAHQPYDIAAGLGWKKSKPQLRKIRQELWKGKAFGSVLPAELNGTPEEIAAILLKLGMQ